MADLELPTRLRTYRETVRHFTKLQRIYALHGGLGNHRNHHPSPEHSTRCHKAPVGSLVRSNAALKDCEIVPVKSLVVCTLNLKI